MRDQTAPCGDGDQDVIRPVAVASNQHSLPSYHLRINAPTDYHCQWFDETNCGLWPPAICMKEKLLEELRFSACIVLAGEEVTPRFLVFCPEGEWHVLVPLPEDIEVRQLRMRLLRGFMAWKSATAFIMSSQLAAPSVIASIAVGQDQVLCAARPVLWEATRTLGPIEWWPSERVGAEIVALLPRGHVPIDPQTEAALVRAFGVGGELNARLC